MQPAFTYERREEKPAGWAKGGFTQPLIFKFCLKKSLPAFLKENNRTVSHFTYSARNYKGKNGIKAL